MVDLNFMAKIAPDMIAALFMTIKLSILSVSISILLGAGLTFARTMGGVLTRYLIISFVEFTRGTPPLVHISIIYFLLPQFGLVLSEFWSGVVALSLIGAGYTIEIFRGALESIFKGQTDAAKALGLTRIQLYFLILMPQAIRRSLPPLTNELANVVKASSLLSVISVNELTKVANDLIFVHFVVIEVLTELTVMYLMVVGILMSVSRWLEKRMK